MCESDEEPELIAAGSFFEGSFNPTLRAFGATASGWILFEDDELEVWLLEPGGEPQLLPEASLYDAKFSPTGRWLVLPDNEPAEVHDLESDEIHEVVLESGARPEFFIGDDGEEAVLLAGDESWVVDSDGPRPLGLELRNFDIAARAPVLLIEDSATHRVVDLMTGEERDVGRGEGVAELSRDGTLMTFREGRSVGGTSNTMVVLDTTTLGTVAEAPYLPLESGYYRRPLHAAGHSIAIAGPGGGVTFIDEDREARQIAGGELLALVGSRHALLYGGGELRLVDLIGGGRSAVPGVSDHPGAPLSTDEAVATSRAGAAVAVAVTMGEQECVVAAHADSADLAVLSCADVESPPRPVWIGDDGTTVVRTYDPAASEDASLRLDVFDPDGELRGSVEQSGYSPGAVLERANFLLLAAPYGSLIELDLATAAVREIARADVIGVASNGHGCEAALSVGCETPSGLPDSGPIVDWELHRLPLGGRYPAVIDPC